MAHYIRGGLEPLKAASAINGFVPVTPLGGASSLDETVIRAGSVNDLPLGFTVGTIATYGLEVGVTPDGARVKAVAAASLGNGALVAVGSTNGRLIPIQASGAASVANYPVRWSVGVAIEDAVDGDVFTVIQHVRQVI